MVDEELTAEVATPKRGLVRRVLRRVFRIPRTPMGIITLAVGAAFMAGFVTWFIPYSESAAFCTSCHTMEPERKAYHDGVHAEVACGECHVSPGITGWVKAKWGGLYELKQLVTNQHTRPLQPIEHPKLPTTQETCMKCHQLDDIASAGNPVKNIIKVEYKDDLANTKQIVALTLRPKSMIEAAGMTGQDQLDSLARGFHWHVIDGLTFYSEGLYAEIPLVELKKADGTVETWIAKDEIAQQQYVNLDIKRLKDEFQLRTMDCNDCHNRIGHDIQDPESAVDEAITAGKISQALPYIKANAVRVIMAEYKTVEAANAAIDAWSTSYAKRAGITTKAKLNDLKSATAEIKAIYAESVSTGMKTNFKSYPNFFGHQNGEGCFRCHDGGHFKVVNGKLTSERIPASCSTCHSFPQLATDGVQLSDEIPPASHAEKFYVFTHKQGLYSTWSAVHTPGYGDCGSCHTDTYCTNCHKLGIDTDHNFDFLSHGTAAKLSQLNTCAKCHQSSYCGGACHGDDIFAGTTPITG